MDRRPQQRQRRVSNRARLVSTIGGFHGAVSLAAALAVPTTPASGRAFPDRDAIIFVTARIIVLTLVLQGLSLPAVVRWARFPHDTSVQQERLLAETLATQEAYAAMPRVAGRALPPHDCSHAWWSNLPGAASTGRRHPSKHRANTGTFRA
ncbi:cation:proton antiporter domain-containing protein [Actinomadura nitritigenes]|uniref:cation:proton antiporter domain-containing protein n=1 Tax=Actinomadura nitritigenes TaxID=134602 RepID=UPI003D8DF4BB